MPQAQTKRSFATKLAAPSLDYVLLHLCMLASIAASVAYEAVLGGTRPALVWLNEELHYYFTHFGPLALLFLVVFWVWGFYRAGKPHSFHRLLVALVPGILVSMLVFLAANFLLYRREMVSRSVLLVFAVLVVFALTISRALWAVLQERFEIRRRPAEEKTRGTVLVIGGAGYIGSALVRRLLDDGRKVRVLDNLTYGDAALREILNHPNLELMAGDCCNIQNVVSAVKDVESIVQLAAIVGDPACEQDRLTSLEVNYAATRMIIEVAKGNGVERLIFASSCSVYGAGEHLMTEDSPLHPISLYAQTKIDSERVLLEARTETFHPVILRFATVFGLSNRPRFDLVVNLLAARACKGEPITIFNGEQWRPFIHVQDVVRAITCALDAPLEAVSGETFNVGDARLNRTLSAVAEEIRAVFPDACVEHVNNNDLRNYRVSFDKVRTRLGFTCSRDIPSGILEVRQAFADGIVLDYKNPTYHNQKYLERFGQESRRNELDRRVMAAFGDISASGSRAGLVM